MRKKKLPENWSGVSLEQGKQIFTLNREILNPEQIKETVYEILTGEEYNSLQVSEVGEVDSAIEQLLNSTHNGELKRRFLINGEFYYLQYDLTRSIWGQWKDWEEIIARDKTENLWNVIEKLLVIILRPAKTIKQTKYNKNKKDKADILEIENIELEDYNPVLCSQRESIFLQHLSVQDVYPIALFFYLAGILYINTLLISLSPQQ